MCLLLVYSFCFLVCQQHKAWGFCLRDLFGLGLGTGDYGHLTAEHASMLLRKFGSLCHYSDQGFKPLHKLQKQIYSRQLITTAVLKPLHVSNKDIFNA